MAKRPFEWSGRAAHRGGLVLPSVGCTAPGIIGTLQRQLCARDHGRSEPLAVQPDCAFLVGTGESVLCPRSLSGVVRHIRVGAHTPRGIRAASAAASSRDGHRVGYGPSKKSRSNAMLLVTDPEPNESYRGRRWLRQTPSLVAAGG
jgi:hypothetical protein